MEGIKELKEYVLMEMIFRRRVTLLIKYVHWNIFFLMLDISVRDNLYVKKLSKHCKMIYYTTIYLFYVHIITYRQLSFIIKSQLFAGQYPNTEGWLGEVRSIPGVSLWTLLHVEEYFITSWIYFMFGKYTRSMF